MTAATRASTDTQLREQVEKETTFPMSSLFVGNLSWNTTDSSLYDAFSEFNPTSATVSVHFDSGTRRSKGWGLVKFNSGIDIQNVIQRMNNALVDQRNISVREDVREDRS